MRILVVHAHPDPDSFNASLFRTTCRVLAEQGGEVDALDLYAEGFQPVMDRAERGRYHDQGVNETGIEREVERLMSADGLVFVYPTWWYGLPSMLKGWLERIWLPHRSFIIPPPGSRGPIRPGMTRIRLLGGISTYGAPWLWTKWVGDPGRRTVMRGVGALCHPRRETFWQGHYLMDQSTPASRATFLDQVERRLRRLRSVQRERSASSVLPLA
ncbi:NAD(P)H-dependent oxidoreductase [Geminicoccus roseus]|uniref:NAD(P)H-dependent oxidoreductase n=1 Tax=Geminicoccus roseus TaxID=404900 RepID=UPI0004250E87|nr:NAD(P)H-dependent oxidoreductase [Geminicoccus roseus]